MWLESINVGLEGTMHLIGSSSVLHSHHMYYCDNCYDNCAYCFGCVGLRNKQYCIFNKQYNKQDYFNTIEQIIQDMITQWIRWHFPPIELSAFAYNETRAHELYPLTEQEALTKWRKRHEEKEIPKAQIWSWYQPKHISQYQTEETQIAQKNEKELVSTTITCTTSGKNFRITKAELELYKRLSVPIPTIHPDQRYQELYSRRPGEILYLRECDKTKNLTLSVYPPQSPQKVYAPDIYQKEIYD